MKWRYRLCALNVPSRCEAVSRLDARSHPPVATLLSVHRAPGPESLISVFDLPPFRLPTRIARPADGVLPSDIAARANERGWHKLQETASATLWTARRIIELLNNRHYIGDIRCRDEWITGQHQPLVDLELYSQARLKIASRRNERKSKVSVPQNRFPKGLILCPDCGRRLSVSSKSRQRKSGATILFSDYCCRSTAGGRPPCLGVPFTATLLEDDVMKAIKLLSETNTELAKYWNKLDLRQQRLLVPRIVDSVSIDGVSETITVKLKTDAWEFLD